MENFECKCDLKDGKGGSFIGLIWSFVWELVEFLWMGVFFSALVFTKPKNSYVFGISKFFFFFSF